MARRRQTQYRANCEGDTLAGRFMAWDKESVARRFVKDWRSIPDGAIVQVWTEGEFVSSLPPATFPIETVR